MTLVHFLLDLHHLMLTNFDQIDTTQSRPQVKFDTLCQIQVFLVSQPGFGLQQSVSDELHQFLVETLVVFEVFHEF